MGDGGPIRGHPHGYGSNTQTEKIETTPATTFGNLRSWLLWTRTQHVGQPATLKSCGASCPNGVGHPAQAVFRASCPIAASCGRGILPPLPSMAARVRGP